MPRYLNDEAVEEELQRLFGLPDDPEVSEDECEPEPETFTDLDVTNILSGFDMDTVLSCSGVEEVPHQDLVESSSSNSLHTEQRSTSSAEVQASTSDLHLDRRRFRISESSSPEVPLLCCPRVVAPSPIPSVPSRAIMSDTDESDSEEDEWKKVLFPQNPNIEYFDSVHLESKQFMPSRTRPVAYFAHFFDHNLIDLIVQQTNIYAEQNRSRGWTPVDTAEIKAFLGIIILMGLHPLPTIDLYWSSDPFFRVAEIASVMTCKRFKKVLENIHLNDNSKMLPRGAPGYDKLYKVRPLLEMLNKLVKVLQKPQLLNL